MIYRQVIYKVPRRFVPVQWFGQLSIWNLVAFGMVGPGPLRFPSWTYATFKWVALRYEGTATLMIEAAKCLLEKEDAGGLEKLRVEKQKTSGVNDPKVMNVHECCLEHLFVYFVEVWFWWSNDRCFPGETYERLSKVQPCCCFGWWRCRHAYSTYLILGSCPVFVALVSFQR